MPRLERSGHPPWLLVATLAAIVLLVVSWWAGHDGAASSPDGVVFQNREGVLSTERRG